MKPLFALTFLLTLVACTEPGAPGGTPATHASAGMPTVPVPSTDTTAGACTADEEVIFACRSGDVAVAVCASVGLSAHDGYLRYSESGPDALDYPAGQRMPAEAFRSGTLMYSGGGGAFIRFEHGGSTRTVYTGIGRGWERAGVQVSEPDGRVVRTLDCEGPVESEIGPALFERAGLPDDPEGFDIP